MLVKHGTEACDENSVSGFGRNALAVDACKVAARCLGLLAAVIIYLSSENIPSRELNCFYVCLDNSNFIILSVQASNNATLKHRSLNQA